MMRTRDERPIRAAADEAMRIYYTLWFPKGWFRLGDAGAAKKGGHAAKKWGYAAKLTLHPLMGRKGAI